MTLDVPMVCRAAATKMNQSIATTQLEVELHVIWHSHLRAAVGATDHTGHRFAVAPLFGEPRL
jgi:hypothetical protein